MVKTVKLLLILSFLFLSLSLVRGNEKKVTGQLLIYNFTNVKTNKVIQPKFAGTQGIQSAALEDSETDENDGDEKIGIFYKGENLLRRAEILFFGSLTIVSFLAWISFSVFNVLIYDEPFGVLQRHQYIALYMGSSVISLSVSLSDLFIRLNRGLKKKNIKIFD